ncbi:MAG: hypothetical protein ACLQMO_12980 [Acidobacteriaceae bacterium]
MAKTLRRILRFRQLAEEQARLEVERAAQLVRQASAACERQTTLEHQQRSTLAESWMPQANSGLENTETSDGDAAIPQEAMEEKGWLMEEAVLEFSGWKRMRLEQLREAELRRMEPMIERYTECRRELRQTEQLLEQQATVEQMEQDRRAQAGTDEWFLQRSLIRRNQGQQRAPSKGKPPGADETASSGD